MDIVITDPRKSYGRETVVYNNEFLISSFKAENIEDIICEKKYNLYLDGELVRIKDKG